MCICAHLKIKTKLCIWYICLYILSVHAWPEEDSRPLVTGIRNSCEPPCGNQTPGRTVSDLLPTLRRSNEDCHKFHSTCEFQAREEYTGRPLKKTSKTPPKMLKERPGICFLVPQTWQCEFKPQDSHKSQAWWCTPVISRADEVDLSISGTRGQLI